MFEGVKAAAVLWALGIWEAAQLQRCVVYVVLDKQKALGAKVLQCFIVNGMVFLGSILAWERGLRPSVRWLLENFVRPCLGATPVAVFEKGLQLSYDVLWLLPVYLLAMLVSCMWYQEVAALAFQVSQPGRPEQQPRPASAPDRPQSEKLAGAAQEVYRVVFFVVFYAEVALIGLLPGVGRLLSVLFLSWLYAYYCYDYKWALQAKSLVERLAFFEQRWAFFAGFGLPMALVTALMSFYNGAAVVAMLFPVYILVACDSDVNSEKVQARCQELWQLPIFKMAVWPTEQVVQLVFGGRRPKRTKPS